MGIQAYVLNKAVIGSDTKQQILNNETAETCCLEILQNTARRRKEVELSNVA